MQRMFPGLRPQSSLTLKRPLTDDEIREVAPSVFAEGAHESRSDRYTYVPTCEIVTQMRAEGFEPFSVSQSRPRDEGKYGHTKHMLRFRQKFNEVARVGDGVGEVVVVNSHDGTSSAHVFGGYFRFICSNGMVIPESTVETFAVRHSGDVAHRVIDAAYSVVSKLGAVEGQRDAMRAITLQKEEAVVFASTALALKYEEPEKAPIRAEHLLRPRRTEDANPTLWNTLNTVQEHLIRGGLRGLSADRTRRVTTRPVEGIDRNVSINRDLWRLAEAFESAKRLAA